MTWRLSSGGRAGQYVWRQSRHAARRHGGIDRTHLFIGAERIGVRLIENVLATEKGAEPLSPRSWELVVMER